MNLQIVLILHMATKIHHQIQSVDITRVPIDVLSKLATPNIRVALRTGGFFVTYIFVTYIFVTYIFVTYIFVTYILVTRLKKGIFDHLHFGNQTRKRDF